MVLKTPLIGALLAAGGLVYGIYPYVTLYWLGQAIRHGDAATLESMVDWNSVREGIKEDLCDLVVDEPQQAQADNRLPAFGTGFMRGIAANAVDKRVTPDALVEAAKQPQADPEEHGASVQVSWAFFASPLAFVVDLHAPGQNDPIRLQMDLREGSWHVTRVWLPADLLGRANART